MAKTLREKLVNLGAEALADLLIEASIENEGTGRKVQRAISSCSENISLFKKKLNNIVGNKNRIIPWKYSSSFADELSDLLQDIRKGASNPEQGLRLLIEFFKADEKILGMVDDSSGHAGDVFRMEASDLFAEYAKQILDKKLIIDPLLDLLSNDDYGVRDELLDRANEFLDLQDLKKLFSQIQVKSKEYTGAYSPYESMLLSIARQMKDGPLFEKLTKKRLNGKLNNQFIVEIASVYFDGGDVEKAQTLLNSISQNGVHSAYEKNELQKKIFQKTGKKAELIGLLEKQFKERCSSSALEELLQVVGQDKKADLTQKAVEDILNKRPWSYENADFLLYCEAYHEAEVYILKHAQELNGDFYYSSLPLAQAMEENEKYLASSLIYRALLDSILRRAKSKNYSHGARYFHKLQNLNKKIKNWAAFPTHDQYFENLQQTHRRKSAFWRLVENRD